MNQETNFANSWSPNQSWNLNTGLSFDLQSSSADSTKGTLHLTISNLSPPYDQLCKVHSVGQKSNKKCSSCNLLFFLCMHGHSTARRDRGRNLLKDNQQCHREYKSNERKKRQSVCVLQLIKRTDNYMATYCQKRKTSF